MTWPYDGDWDGKSTNCLAAIEASIMIAINERLNCLGVDKKEWYYNNEGDKKTDVTSSDLVGLSIWGNYSQRNITQMVHAFRKTSGAGYLLKGGHGSIRDYDFHRYHAMVSSDSDEVVTLGWLISQIGLGDFPYISYSSPYLENILNTNFWLRMQKAFDYLLHYQIKLCPQATIETESGFSGMWLGSSLYDWAGAISLAWTNRWAIPSSSSSSTDSVGVHFETFFGYYDGQDLAGAQLSIHKIDVPFIFSTSKLTGVLGKTLIQWGYWILGAGDSVTGAIQARIGDIVSGIWSTIIENIKSVINIAIGLINVVIRQLNKLSFPNPFKKGETIGVSIGEIPKLADGGIATAPTLAMVGEGGESEAIIPLSKLGNMGGYNTANITIEIDGQKFAQIMGTELVDYLNINGVTA